MQHTKQDKAAVIAFIGCILLAGVCNLLTRTRAPLVNTFMFCANVMIYIGLLLYWMLSVRARLLPTKARSYAIASAILMIFELLVRVLRYRILSEIVIRRYSDYAINVPLILVPTLFLMTCIRISRGEEAAARGRERLLLIPSCTLALLILTNDLHRLFYRPTIPLSEFHGIIGTYTYGPLFYMLYGWMVATLVAGFVILIRKTWRQNKRTLFQFGGVVLFWGGLSLINRLIFMPLDLVRMFHAPEINVFGMLGSFEVCILNRLIPHNENYAGFFGSMRLPVLITDRELNTVWESAVPLRPTREQMTAALEGPVRVEGDAVLYGRSAGVSATFWAQDEGTIRRLNEELEDANDTLALENELLEREREQLAEIAMVKERNALYAEAALAVYPAQKKIDALLSRAEPDTPAFRTLIAQAAQLSAYVKRKSNFVMVAAQRDAVAAEELAAAVSEIGHYCGYCGLRVTLDNRAERSFSSGETMDILDTLEALLEMLKERGGDCLVRLEDAGFVCMADGEAPPELPESPCPVSVRAEDGQLLLTAKVGGDAL